MGSTGAWLNVVVCGFREKDLDPEGKQLAATKDPLGEATKLVQQLKQYAGDRIKTHLLAFEVGLLSNKPCPTFPCLPCAVLPCPAYQALSCMYLTPCELQGTGTISIIVRIVTILSGVVFEGVLVEGWGPGAVSALPSVMLSFTKTGCTWRLSFQPCGQAVQLSSCF